MNLHIPHDHTQRRLSLAVTTRHPPSMRQAALRRPVSPLPRWSNTMARRLGCLQRTRIG